MGWRFADDGELVLILAVSGVLGGVWFCYADYEQVDDLGRRGFALKCIDDPSDENKKAAAWAAMAVAKADAVAARESANTDIAAQIIDKGLELLQQYPNPNAT